MIAPFINILTAPKRAFMQIGENPSWLFIVVPIILVVFGSILFQKIPQIEELVENKKYEILETQTNRIMAMDIPEEQKDEILQRMEEQVMAEQSPAMQFILAPTMLFLMIVLLAGIFHFFGNFVLGGQVSYFQNLNVVGITMIIIAIAIIVKIPIFIVSGTLDIDLSPAIFAIGFDDTTFVAQFMKKFDFFNIWIAVLLSLGFSVTYGVGKKRGFTIIFGIWIVMNIIFTVIGQMLEGLIR